MKRRSGGILLKNALKLRLTRRRWVTCRTTSAAGSGSCLAVAIKKKVVRTFLLMTRTMASGTCRQGSLYVAVFLDTAA